MKFLILGVLTMLSVNAFAQQSPAEVCQQVSRYSGQSGADCAGALSQGHFDPGVIQVAYAVAQTGSYTSATKIMQMSPNRYMDDDVAAACIAIARFSGQSAASCVEVALDNAFTPSLAAVATTIAQTGSYTSAVTAVRNAANGYAHSGAAEVCKAIARFSGQSAADCITAIINKDYYNNAESVCLTLANQGSYTSAVTCMRNAGVQTQQRPYRRPRDWDRPSPRPTPGPSFPQPQPVPGPSFPAPRDPYTMNVGRSDIEDLARNISKAQSQYNRGMYQQMGNTLIDLQRKIDEIKATAR